MAESTTAVEAPTSLWRNSAFTRLWFAGMVSNAGTQITNLALPLTAALVLGATPAQMGLLAMAGSLPNLLFGLFAGVWVDRTRRGPILIGADLARAVLLGSIPIAALLDALVFAHIWIVVFATATLTVFFQIASVAVLPAVVKSTQLVEANSKLEISGAVLSIAGPGGAGGLIQLLGAPKAIIMDALSYVLSALSLRGIAIAETPRSKQARSGIWTEIGEGMHALVRTPILRALTLSGAVGGFGFAMQSAVLVLFLTRELGLSAAAIGFVYACGGGGSLLGAVVAGRLGRRIGIGQAVVVGNLLWICGGFAVPLAGLAGASLPYLVVGEIVAGIGATVFSVNQLSLRQHLTPIDVLGRVTAARRFLLFSMAPLGAGLGGILGGALGLRPTLIGGALVLVASVLLVSFSPVRSVRDLSGVGNI